MLFPVHALAGMCSGFIVLQLPRTSAAKVVQVSCYLVRFGGAKREKPCMPVFHVCVCVLPRFVALLTAAFFCLTSFVSRLQGCPIVRELQVASDVLGSYTYYEKYMTQRKACKQIGDLGHWVFRASPIELQFNLRNCTILFLLC